MGGELQQPPDSAQGRLSSEAGASPSVTGPPPPDSLWDCRNQQRIQLPPPHHPFFLTACLDLASGKARPCTTRRGPGFPGLPTGFCAETQEKAARWRG